MPESEFYENLGKVFVDFVSQYGYDRVLSILGRHMRDFLNGLDNLHEYLKFSYPRMKAPSFFCENENQYGLTLHYRSKRKGYLYYAMGQIKAVGKHFYGTDVKIEVIKEEMLFDTVNVTFQLHFENTAYLRTTKSNLFMDQFLPIKSQLFFEIFPFCIVFGSDMIIRNIGHSLQAVLPDLIGKKITDAFNLARPLIDFTWRTVLLRTNNIFELVTVAPVSKSKSEEELENVSEVIKESAESEEDVEVDNNGTCLSLKGQMLYMDEWRSIIFLGTPMMQDLDAMFNAGLYINDLSMHDFSRDLMLAGTQQSVELKLALDQEQQKSKRLEESMRKLDEEMKRTDELLYQMIPKAVADRLRRGTPAISTCEVFDSVTILFSDVVTFTQICCHISPMEVVSLLNSMYSIFDKLTGRHQVYKVETIGDAYMVVSGAPEKRSNHAEKVCDMALDMMHSITGLKDPSNGDSLAIRIGIHSGTVVAGIVGLKMPRYCLFGDTVNTASRMESTSEPMKIHISETTRDLVCNCDYEITERGTIPVKGKGNMKTYWLECRTPRRDHLDLLPDNDLSTSRTSNSPSTNIHSRSTSPEGRFSPSSRSLYSPVTFDEVARHRQLSPIRQHAYTWNSVVLMEKEQDSRNSTPRSNVRLPHLASACIAAGVTAAGIVPPMQTSDKPTCSDRKGPIPLEHRVHVTRECNQLPTQSATGSSSEWADHRAKTDGLDAKPIAILFPCLHRNVAPGGEEQNEKKASNYEGMQSPTPGISRRKITAKSTYCSAL